MPKLVNHLGEIAPKARVHTVPNTVIEIADQLEDNRVDCVLSVYVNEAQQPAAIRSRSLWTVDYACFMRRDHPLAAGKRLGTRAFLNAGHVDVSLAGKTLPSYDLFLASRGLSRNLVATVNHYSAAYEIVRQSDLIAVLPRDLRSQSRHAPFLHAMPLPLQAPPRIVSLFWHQRNDTVPGAALAARDPGRDVRQIGLTGSALERGDHHLDQRAAAEIGDADGGAGRQIVAEELGPGRVHLLLLGQDP